MHFDETIKRDLCGFLVELRTEIVALPAARFELLSIFLPLALLAWNLSRNTTIWLVLRAFLLFNNLTHPVKTCIIFKSALTRLLAISTASSAMATVLLKYHEAYKALGIHERTCDATIEFLHTGDSGS